MSERLAIVRPTKVPDGTSPEDVPTYTVGASWLRQWPDDFTLIRYVDETPEQAAARPTATPAEPAATPVKQRPTFE